MIRAFCLPWGFVKFFSDAGTEKTVGSWFARGGQYPAGFLMLPESIGRDQWHEMGQYDSTRFILS